MNIIFMYIYIYTWYNKYNITYFKLKLNRIFKYNMCIYFV